MVPRFSETPIDSAKGRSPDFGIKLSEFLKFIENLDIEIPPDVLPELPEEERKISFTEEEINEIERRLSAAPRLFEHFFRRFFNRPQETTKEEISKNHN